MFGHVERSTNRPLAVKLNPSVFGSLIIFSSRDVTDNLSLIFDIFDCENIGDKDLRQRVSIRDKYAQLGMSQRFLGRYTFTRRRDSVFLRLLGVE